MACGCGCNGKPGGCGGTSASTTDTSRRYSTTATMTPTRLQSNTSFSKTSSDRIPGADASYTPAGRDYHSETARSRLINAFQFENHLPTRHTIGKKFRVTTKGYNPTSAVLHEDEIAELGDLENYNFTEVRLCQTKLREPT